MSRTLCLNTGACHIRCAVCSARRNLEETRQIRRISRQLKAEFFGMFLIEDVVQIYDVPKLNFELSWLSSARHMPVSTLSAAVHITPVVIKTFVRHGKRLARKRNEKHADKAQDDILFDEQVVFALYPISLDPPPEHFISFKHLLS